jgi:putative ABC transport system permease protein
VTRVILARIRELFQRRRLERELDDELAFHLECEVAARVARGASPEAARRDAMLAFGGVQRFREETREARAFVALDRFSNDIRFAIRRLLRAPAFTFGTVLTLGLGVGVAAGIGTLVYGVTLRPLPYPDPERLVTISVLTPGLGIVGHAQSSGTFVFLAERARAYATLGAYMENSAVSITEGDTPERVAAALLTPNVLPMLGAVPAAGRLLTDDDAAVGFTSPVMISYELWQRRYGGNAGVVGRYIELNRGKRMIAGVLPRGFHFPTSETAIYYPEQISASRSGLTDRSLTVLGRLAQGVSLGRAQRELDALLPRLGERFPEIAGAPLARARVRGLVETMRDAMTAPVRSELRLLAALVVVLLGIAMANVGTLALLRADRFQLEIAVLRALGASAGAVRQRWMVEGAVVALVGGVVATVIAALAIATKLGVAGVGIPRIDEIAMSPEIGAIIVSVTATIGLAVGAVMSARAGRTDSASLRADARVTGGRAWCRAQKGLVSVQIAMAMTLLLGAGLCTASMLRLRRVDLGFVAKDGAQFALQIPFRGYETYQRTAAFDLAVIEALRHTTGVSAAAGAMELPSTPQLLDMRPSLEAARLDGQRVSAAVRINVVSPEFFHVMGIALRAGRTFQAGDLASPTPGVVLGAALARELFGSANPVGREVRFTSGRYPSYRVVGVSADVFSDRVTDGPLPSVYFPLLNDLPPSSTETEHRIPVMPGGMHFVVRSGLSLESLTPAFRAAVRAVDPRVPVWDVRRLDDIVAGTTARLRLSMLLLGASACATLLLGAIGIYSVVAYVMVGRSRELALRLALGATPSGLARLVYRESFVMIGVGVAGGAVLSLAGGRILRSVLYEVSPTDPLLFAACVAAVAIIATAAVCAPARQAGRTDPASVLRG